MSETMKPKSKANLRRKVKTLDERKQIITRYQRGESIRALEQDLGIAGHVIANELLNMGVSLRGVAR